MIVYIPAPSAQPLSDALWGLTRPPFIRHESNTQYLFPWVKALDSSIWLLVETTYTISVHSEAVLDGIAGILQPFIDAQQLPADTNNQLDAFIESKRGHELVIYDAFPQLFKDQAKTWQQMIDAGLLSQPAIS